MVRTAAAVLTAGALALAGCGGDDGGGSSSSTPASTATTKAKDVGAEQLFVAGNPSTGAVACGSCHTLKAAGTTGTAGPNLDESLASDDRAAAIKEMIVDPDAEIVEGYAKGVMPTTYAKSLTAAQIDELAAYVDKSVHGDS